MHSSGNARREPSDVAITDAMTLFVRFRSLNRKSSTMTYVARNAQRHAAASRVARCYFAPFHGGRRPPVTFAARGRMRRSSTVRLFAGSDRFVSSRAGADRRAGSSRMAASSSIRAPGGARAVFAAESGGRDSKPFCGRAIY